MRRSSARTRGRSTAACRSAPRRRARADRARVPHHLVGFLDPHERYSAARFVADALAAIDAIHARGRRAIVAGGTGFYLRALTRRRRALSPAYDAALRDRLAHEARVHPPEVLAEWLRALAPQRAAAIAPNDPYRVTRALEVALAERAGARRDDAREHGALNAARARDSVSQAVSRDRAATSWSRGSRARVDAMLANGLARRSGARSAGTRSRRTRSATARRWRTSRAGRRLRSCDATDPRHPALREAAGHVVPNRAGARSRRRRGRARARGR